MDETGKEVNLLASPHTHFHVPDQKRLHLVVKIYILRVQNTRKNKPAREYFLVRTPRRERE